MISERLKFFADTPKGEKNKLFCFKTDLLTLRETIKRFYGLKFNIRAAWYEKLEPETGAVIENTRIPTTTLQEIFNEVIRECTSNSIANKK